MDFMSVEPPQRLMSLGEVSKKKSGTKKPEGPTFAPPFSQTLCSDRVCGLVRPSPSDPNPADLDIRRGRFESPGAQPSRTLSAPWLHFSLVGAPPP